jgi:hypothetical protein
MSDAPAEKISTSNAQQTPKPADNKPLSALEMSEEAYQVARLALTKTKPHNILGFIK